MASGIIRGTTSNDKIDVWLEWRAEAYPADNKSVFNCYLYYERNNTGYTTEGTWNGSIIVNGVEYAGSKKVVLSYDSNTEVMNCFGAIGHNTDGTKSITISATGSISGTTLTATYLSATVELDTIYRNATIVSAPDFNDEGNPKITYSNKAGNTVSSLQACIADSNGVNIYVPYRDISKTGTSYTFSLTDAERKTLRTATTGKSRTVKFYIKSVLNGETYYSSIAKTFSIVNGNPTLAPTVEDTSVETLALTGSKDILIKYFSDATFTTGATAIKEATLKSQKVSCGSKSATTATGTLQDVESGNFTFTATDSRGFTTTQTVKKTIIDYIKLTCNIEAEAPTATGEMVLNVSGNYFNNNFGASDNVLIVNYRYKENDGDWGEWVAGEAVVSGNTYSCAIAITGLNYQSKYTFQARSADLLMTVDSAERSVKTTPIFDWGADDFNFNVPITYTEDGTKYNISSIGKALMNVYNLPCDVSAGANYSSASGSCSLAGNILRVYFTAKRTSSASAGNISNEPICSFTVDTGGKIKGVYAVYAMCANNNACIQIGSITTDDNTLKFTITLNAVGIASTTFTSYFSLPCRVDLSMY